MNFFGFITALKNRSLPAQMTLLVAVMLVAYAGVFCFARDRGGAAGLVAASLAGGVCLASAVTALLMSHSMSGPASGAIGMLLPTFARTAPPLILALLVRLRGQALVETGFVYYLIGFYLLALVVELPMSLPRITQSGGHTCGPAGKDRRVHG